jgi:hypothetical protein
MVFTFSHSIWAVIGFFITLLAVQHIAKPRSPALLGQHPIARYERGIMTNVLKVAAIEFSSPMTFVISFKSFN